MADLLEAMAELRPMLLLLDDLHHADEATLALFGTLARRAGRRRLMLVGACRPASMAGPASLRRLMLDLLVHRAAEEMPLAPLTPTDIAAWLAEMAAGRPAPDALVDLLRVRSDGNPMLAGAILEHLLEQGAVRRAEPQGWVAPRPLPPETAREAPRARQMLDLEIEDLTAAERKALDAASVAGRSFCAWSVQVVLDVSAAEAEELCHALCRRGLLREMDHRTILPNGTASPRFAFVHRLFRDILHQRQAASQRAVWHRCLGERAEANWGVRAPVIAAELAYRFRQGEDWRRAILYSRHAAREAPEGAGADVALGLLRQALEGCRHLPEAERAGMESALRQDIARMLRLSRSRSAQRPQLAAPLGPDGAPAH
jgi:predicted ATPase